jgi:alpha-amylase/alpha-mannosidase (GH57 family)
MKPVRLAILWHMHQPLYREPATGTYILPWVRLHATRAYNDMAWILERHPGVRVTVNFTPVLLEQIEDYAAGRARDTLLDLSAREPADLAPEERRRLLHSFFMVDWDRSVRPVPPMSSVSPVNRRSSTCRHIESRVWPGVWIACRRSRPTAIISPSPMRMSA